MPYFLVGDDAFALKKWMMKPYSHRHLTVEERIFNYRLSRARRIVENAFGILANRFRVLLSTMHLDPDSATLVAMACVVLHNLLRIRNPGPQVDEDRVEQVGQPDQAIPGAWRDPRVMEEVNAVRGPTREAKEAKQQRVYLKHYVNNIGAVAWQRDMI